jgi:ABC-type glycerol-3-phosphate transport system substrate-binding protein
MFMKRWLGGGLAVLMLVTMGAGCFGQSGPKGQGGEPVELDFWSVFDDETAYRDIIKAYESRHPNVSVNYRRLRPEEYEPELVRAFAEGSGPDIFSVHNTKIAETQSLMQPMPGSVTVAYLETQGTLRKETLYVQREEPTITQKALKQDFVDAVVGDVIRPYRSTATSEVANRIFGLPMSVDTMVMYYNKDLLNAAGIAEPPTTWDAFQDAVIKLTVTDPDGNVTQSGAALGTTDNVERSSDLITLLMMQNGTVMSENNAITFGEIPEGTPDNLFPALDAVRFYTDFANPTKEVYTWNETLPSSFEAFVNGQAAFFFGYSYHISYILAAAPKLNYAIAKMPQIAGGRQVNVANYWVNSVAKNSDVSDYAWDFIQYSASADQAAKYLTKAKKPTARRGLINTQLNDENMGPFAEQVLTAQSWYKGRDAEAMEKALNDLADSVLAGQEPEDALARAVQIVRQTY